MKKINLTIFLICSVFLLQGSGYKGTLPDLNTREIPINDKIIQPQNDILPLDKLTFPIKHETKIDKTEVKFKEDMIDIIRQLDRIKEVLDADKSFKNFVAAANMLNLSTENIKSEFNEERFSNIIGKLADINDDTQQMKEYWIKINKNAPYVSYYTTKGAYSGAVLNEQLNKFSYALGFAIRDLKNEFKIE